MQSRKLSPRDTLDLTRTPPGAGDMGEICRDCDPKLNREVAIDETDTSTAPACSSISGRLVLPKKVRDELRLEPGDTLDLVSDGQQVTLRPTRSAARLRKHRGVWVFSCGTPIRATETDEVLEEIRQSSRNPFYTLDQSNLASCRQRGCFEKKPTFLLGLPTLRQERHPSVLKHILARFMLALFGWQNDNGLLG